MRNKLSMIGLVASLALVTGCGTDAPVPPAESGSQEATGLQIVAQPTSGVPNTVLGSLQVQFVDGLGNTVPTEAGIGVTLASNPTGALLGGTTSGMSNSDGLAEFLDLTINKKGIYRLAAFTSALAAVPTGNITVGGGASVFAPRTPLAAAGPFNAGPDHVHTGDLNGDGQLDLVSSSFGDNLLSVNLATGNGNFAAKTSQTTPITNPGDFVLGDYNGDGKLDVVVTGFAGGAGTQVMFYRGDGTGSFAAPLLFNVGTGPFTIAQGDFNQDGLADLAVGNVFSGDLTLLLGNGTSFPTATNFALGGLSPGDTSVADFNNDGFADVAVVLSGSDRVALLLGNGQGGLAGPTNLATGTFPINSSVADFNGDGRADLIVGNGNSQTFSLFLNNGGGLNPAVSLPAGDRPNAITTGDVNLDGIADLVNSRPGGLVQLRLGVGDGTFQAPSNLNIDTGNGNGDVEIADLNQDTVPDLAVAVTAPAQVLNILLQTP